MTLSSKIFKIKIFENFVSMVRSNSLSETSERITFLKNLNLF